MSTIDSATVRANRDSAQALGWVPADFGAADHGPVLCMAVMQWQTAHLLPATGVVDATTWRALQDWREGLEDKAARAVSDANLAGLCSVSRYHPSAPAVLASKPFEGVALHVDRLDRLEALSVTHAAALGSLVVPVLGVPRTRVALPFGLRLLARLDVDAAMLADPARAADTLARRWARPGGIDGVVLNVTADGWQAVAARPPAFTAAVAWLRGNLPGVKLAVSALLRPSGMPVEARRAWRVLGACDAYLPPVPGAWPGGGIESALGGTVGAWSIFAHLRPNFAFPVYHAHPGTTPAQVHRFRHWLRARGARGYGWAGDTAHLDALLGPLPEDVDRVDYRRTPAASKGEP